MSLFRTPLRLTLAVAIALPALVAAGQPVQAGNSTGALIGGLVAGALVGSAITAATQPKTYYYAPPPPPPPAYYPPPPPPRPVYGPGYCGAPPYPPCRTPVY